MIAEAAVMAQNLGINRSTAAMDQLSTRVFWVLYYMEKTSCFVTGKVPVCPCCEDVMNNVSNPDRPFRHFKIPI